MDEFVHSFFVPGVPVAKARPRFARGVVYTPGKTVAYETLMKLSCGWGKPPVEGPLKVVLMATFPYPKSWSKKRIAATRWHTSKPDADNLVKTLDALNGVLWVDDSQVAHCTAHKQYGEHPGLEVWVWKL